jgi:hypothetical protein
LLTVKDKVELHYIPSTACLCFIKIERDEGERKERRGREGRGERRESNRDTMPTHEQVPYREHGMRDRICSHMTGFRFHLLLIAQTPYSIE